MKHSSHFLSEDKDKALLIGDFISILNPNSKISLRGNFQEFYEIKLMLTCILTKVPMKRMS